MMLFSIRVFNPRLSAFIRGFKSSLHGTGRKRDGAIWESGSAKRRLQDLAQKPRWQSVRDLKSYAPLIETEPEMTRSKLIFPGPDHWPLETTFRVWNPCPTV
jgi:hypothetical protein